MYIKSTHMDEIRKISQTIHEILMRDPQWRWVFGECPDSTHAAGDRVVQWVLYSGEVDILELNIGYNNGFSEPAIATIYHRRANGPSRVPLTSFNMHIFSFDCYIMNSLVFHSLYQNFPVVQRTIADEIKRWARDDLPKWQWD